MWEIIKQGISVSAQLLAITVIVFIVLTAIGVVTGQIS